MQVWCIGEINRWIKQRSLCVGRRVGVMWGVYGRFAPLTFHLLTLRPSDVSHPRRFAHTLDISLPSVDVLTPVKFHGRNVRVTSSTYFSAHSVIWYGEPPDAPQPVAIPITPEIKRSIPWFTGYLAITFRWNLSITFSAIYIRRVTVCYEGIQAFSFLCTGSG